MHAGIPAEAGREDRPLPEFILENDEFMEAFYKAHPHLVGPDEKDPKKQKGYPNLKFLQSCIQTVRRKPTSPGTSAPGGSGCSHHARRDLARYYPTYADFEPLDQRASRYPTSSSPCAWCRSKDDGTPDIDALNAEFSEDYLADKRNPRWVAKPTVAYLWARTVKCKNCRATIPLLKTRGCARRTRSACF